MAGFADGFFAQSPDDPRFAANMALFASMMRGDLPGGLTAHARALQEGQAAAERRKLTDLQARAAEQGLQKGSLELAQLREAIERNNRIRARKAEQQPGAAAPTLSTPEVGGVPMFSQGTTAAPAPATAKPAGNAKQQLASRLIAEANIHQSEGDFDGADKLFERAAKFMPEVHKIEVGMKDGQPVNVITFKDGTQEVSAFGAKPEVEILDLGGTRQAIDKLRLKGGESFPKTMTPGERDSSARGWQQLAQDRQGVTYQQDGSGNIVALPNKLPAGAGMARAIPVAAAGGGLQPLAGKPSEAVQKEKLSINQQRAVVDSAITAAQTTPSAFSFKRGAATMAGAIPESLAGRMDSDQERQARAFVYNNVSKVINERAGAAQSAQELARLRSFLPAETDNHEQVVSKLKAFRTYLDELDRGTTTSPQSPAAPRAAAPLPFSPAAIAAELARRTQ